MKQRTKNWAMASAVVYLAGLLAVAFWPTHVDDAARPWLDQIIGWIHQQNLQDWFSYQQLEFGANIVYFLPLGILCMWWLKRPVVSAVIGLAVSAFIESGQLLFLPGRTPSTFDLLANTLGTILGVLVFRAAHRWYIQHEWKVVPTGAEQRAAGR